MEQRSFTFDADAELDKEWYNLTLAHVFLQATPPNDPECEQKLADAIAKLQAYGRVLRRIEKEVEHYKNERIKRGVLLAAASAGDTHNRIWEDVG